MSTTLAARLTSSTSASARIAATSSACRLSSRLSSSTGAVVARNMRALATTTSSESITPSTITIAPLHRLPLPPHSTTTTTSQPTTIATSTSEPPKFIPFPLGFSPVYDAAYALLQQERSALKADLDRLKSQSAPPTDETTALIRRRSLELGHTDLETQFKFNVARTSLKPVSLQNPEEIGDPEVVWDLSRRRFREFVVPRLIKASERDGLFRDVFPGKGSAQRHPELEVVVNWDGVTRWEGCYGHAIPPNWALYSPTVILISTTSNKHLNSKDRYYTLLLTDLDRPNPNTRQVEEWCHWLVTNIKLPAGQKSVVVPGGESVFLGNVDEESVPPEWNVKGTSFHMVKPPVVEGTEGKEKVGTTVFPYVPPHPANENPRRVHRYVFLVMEQPDGKILDASQVNVDKIREEVRAREAEAQAGEVKSWTRRYEGAGEEKMEVTARFGVPGRGFLKRHGLWMRGHAYVTSGWNLYSPGIYSRLELHEPVYGILGKDTESAVHAIARATNLASKHTPTLEQLTSSSAEALKALNYGTEQPPLRSLSSPLASRFVHAENVQEGEGEGAEPKVRVPFTRLGLEALAMRKAAAEAKIKAEAKNAGKKKASTSSGKKRGEVVPEKERSVGARQKKLPRLTVLGSVGFVKSREGEQLAQSGMSERYLKARGRYQNV